MGRAQEIIDDSKLQDATAKAIRRTLEVIRREHPDERLRGFALCTDDNACTILAAATLRDARETPESLELEFATGEWEIVRDECFGPVRSLLKARDGSEADGPAEWKKTFRAFVDALKAVRDEGHFGEGAEREDVVLVVTSTDPSRELAEMGYRWIKELNRPSVHRRLQAILARSRPRVRSRPKAKAMRATKPTTRTSRGSR